LLTNLPEREHAKPHEHREAQQYFSKAKSKLVNEMETGEAGSERNSGQIAPEQFQNPVIGAQPTTPLNPQVLASSEQSQF
jgi:hypothetical protein